MAADEASALGSNRGASAGSIAQASYPAMSAVVVPPGIAAPNKLYVSFVPQTTAGCSMYGWLPMWLQTYGSGPVWFYEWYPNGALNVNSLGYSYPGWHKMWFNGDAPGWHVLQYYSGGWSNYIYIYIYVYPWSSWRNPGFWWSSNEKIINPPTLDTWLNPPGWHTNQEQSADNGSTNPPNRDTWLNPTGWATNQEQSVDGLTLSQTKGWNGGPADAAITPTMAK